MKIFYLLTASVTVFGVVYGQSFEGTYFGELITQLNETQLSETISKKFEEPCFKITGKKETVDDLKSASENLTTCIKEIFDGIDQEKSNEIFMTICKKKPELLGCVDKFRPTYEKCLEDDAKAKLKTIINLFNSTWDLMCSTDVNLLNTTDRCLKSKQNELQACGNQSIYFKSLEIQSIPNLLHINDKECKEFTVFQKCTNNVLKTCENQGPANVTDSLLEHIKKGLPCWKTNTPVSTRTETRKIETGSGNSITSFSGLFIISFVSLLTACQSI